MTLPVALSGKDVIGQAKTGTGKTLGFGLPLLERVTVPADVEAGRAAPEDLTEAPQALVVVPTRELCTQVTNDLLTAGKVRNVRVLAIYGGRAYEPQVEALKKGVDVVVGTPGRLLDLAGQKKLSLKHIRSLVLDEADEMLDLGFLPDVEKIINMLPVKRQTMLFSATMPGAVIGLARRYMSQPTHISATSPDDAGATVANTAQFVYRAHNMDKPEMVARLLQAEGRGLAMVFCRTKRTAADLADQLKQRGFASGAVHGDLGQGAREQALRAFRNGKVDVLVCTDVAARGIDVEGVTHVVNYQTPEDEKTYLHRIGRTGRAGASGTAVTLVDWDDIPRWQLINKALDLKHGDPPETYSTSPHFYEDLKIPAGTKGVLPRSERTRAGLDAEVLEDLGEPGGRAARGRGGRDGRDNRSGRDSRDEARSTERAPRTPRRRRRTRNGAPLDGTPAVTTGPSVTDGAVAEQTVPADEATSPRTPRRRRRTRGGPGQDAVAGTPVTAPSAEAAPVAAEAAVTTAEGPAAEATRPPRRRRTRRSADAAAVTPETPAAEIVVESPATVLTAPEPVAPAEAVPAQAVAEPVAVVEAVPAQAVAEPVAVVEATPRRRTRKAAAPAEGTVAEAADVDTVTAVVAAPRRTRKTAAPAEAAVDTAEAVEAKPRRTRKAAAAPVADIPAQAADEAETAEVKPRRTRKTAATKAAEAAVETSAEAVEPTVATKPRRTRKTAAAKAAEAAEAAVDTAEAGDTAVATKPRRTRKTAAAKTAEVAPAAEVAPVETADAPVEAKPRRTRKTAVAKAAEAAVAVTEAAVEAVEAAVTKPRRTRKTAAAKTVEVAEAAVDIAGASGTAVATKPRRTRKAAAAPVADIPAQAADEAETAEVKPRRTRKTAATKAAEAAVETSAEVKPRTRRPRKTAAAADVAES
ncbi:MULTISPECIES: DEAD/DEAH box helicase [unclassified Streptomyces]|uniref:DEAD/DEAH box helicase n=1 Tax=unclassified Streptomyces TaxID=2593676 RepID=UPI0037F714F6